MKAKFFSVLIACFVVVSVFSQNNLNDYKYIIVPNKFDFLKQKNQYQLNSLTNFLFNKYGFQTLMEGDNYPADLVINRCLALRSDVLKGSGMFKTKLNVVLKDCNDRLVYTSPIGESREKVYKKAYNEALRNAFKSLAELNYSYKPNENSKVIASQMPAAKNEVAEELQKLKEEIESLKAEKVTEVVEVTPKVIEVVEAKVEAPVKEVKIMEAGVQKVLSSVLYAQEIENGFQLVDSSPKVLYRIKNTGLSNVFLVDGKNAIIYKKDGVWVLEYYSNSILKREVLTIKF